MSLKKKLIPNSYWVRPGRIAAGEYPGAAKYYEAAQKLSDLLMAGVNHFVDLTHPEDGLEPYDQIAKEEAIRLGKTVHHEQHSIIDLSVPQGPHDMTRILDAIDCALNIGRTLYVHCWGGVGRTGTVIGCWLVRHGLTGEQALLQIDRWWKDVEKAWRFPSSPETMEQRSFVRQWRDTHNWSQVT